MRPRRPYFTPLADVTINRSGESAVITYRDPAVRPVVFAIGTDIDRCSDAEILARFNDSLHAARAQTEGCQHVVVAIPRGHTQLEYFAPAGQWVPRGAVLRCLIDESPESEPLVYIDDHALSLSSSVDSCVPTRAGACESFSSKTTTPSLRSSRYETSRTEKRLTIGGDQAGACSGLSSGPFVRGQDWYHCFRPVPVYEVLGSFQVRSTDR